MKGQMSSVTAIILVVIMLLAFLGAWNVIGNKISEDVKNRNFKWGEGKGISGIDEKSITSISCGGADLNKISSLSFDLKKCDTYRKSFVKYMKEYGLTDKVDLLLIYALTYQESSCNKNINKGGIMQVDHGCLDRSDNKCITDVDFAIKKGVEEFSQKYNGVSSDKLSDGDVVKLVLFGYNRGIAAAKRAVEYREKGTELHDSMVKACDDYYPLKITGICGSKWDLKKCCDSPGLGAGYPDKILSYFEKACNELKGK